MKNQKPFPSDFKRNETPNEYWAEKIIGFMGRMIGGSKSIYRYDNPDNLVIFNANIATKEDGKIWHGDLDLTKDHSKLMELVEKIGLFYIFYESDLRFGKEENPDFSLASCSYDKDGFKEISMYGIIVKDENGVPKMSKEDPKEELIETTVSHFEDKQHEFEEIEIPDISKFKVKKGVSVWGTFQEEFIKIHGKEKAQEVYLSLFLTKEDCNKIDELNEKTIKKTMPYLHPVKIQQGVSMDSFSYGCCEFQINPTWAKSGIGYVRKKG